MLAHVFQDTIELGVLAEDDCVWSLNINEVPTKSLCILSFHVASRIIESKKNFEPIYVSINFACWIPARLHHSVL